MAWYNEIKRDCYWYSEELDMGAILSFCGLKDGLDTLESCEGCNKYLSKQAKTNSIRIRAMSDEELAEFISNKARTFGEEYEGYMSALDWLKQESS